MTTKLLLVLIALGVWMIALDPWLHPIPIAAQGPGLRSWRSHPAECASCYFLTPVFALRSVVISTPSADARRHRAGRTALRGVGTVRDVQRDLWKVWDLIVRCETATRCIFRCACRPSATTQTETNAIGPRPNRAHKATSPVLSRFFPRNANRAGYFREARWDQTRR